MHLVGFHYKKKIHSLLQYEINSSKQNYFQCDVTICFQSGRISRPVWASDQCNSHEGLYVNHPSCFNYFIETETGRSAMSGHIS